MKKQYIPPTLKVVSFKIERGFQTSIFQRIENAFLMESLDDEFRGEQFALDDWSSSSPSPNDNQFGNNDWGSM